jgi:Tfp pilus assembly protein PilV
MNLVNQKSFRQLSMGLLALSAVLLMPLSLGACASAQSQKVRSSQQVPPASDLNEAQKLRQVSASMWHEQYFLMEHGGGARFHR